MNIHHYAHSMSKLPTISVLAVLTVSLLLSACGESPEYVEEPEAIYIEEVGNTLPPADNYKVELGVDEFIELPGAPGELRIWIGSEQEQASFPSGFVSDQVTLSVSGQTATISPFAPDFTITPATSQCIRVHPSGSEVIFQLTPTKSGDFNVGANVNLYDTTDCSGAPIPKSTARLKVTVTVNNQAVVMGGALELWSVFWVKLLDFWGAVVALFFALLIFLIRKKLKQWFGFSSEEK